jgi:hypothetical protein
VVLVLVAVYLVALIARQLADRTGQRRGITAVTSPHARSSL